MLGFLNGLGTLLSQSGQMGMLGAGTQGQGMQMADLVRQMAPAAPAASRPAPGGGSARAHPATASPGRGYTDRPTLVARLVDAYEDQPLPDTRMPGPNEREQLIPLLQGQRNAVGLRRRASPERLAALLGGASQGGY